MYSKNLSSKISENKKSEKFALSQAPTLSLVAQPLLKSRGLFNVIPDRNRRILLVWIVQCGCFGVAYSVNIRALFYILMPPYILRVQLPLHSKMAQKCSNNKLLLKQCIMSVPCVYF